MVDLWVPGVPGEHAAASPKLFSLQAGKQQTSREESYSGAISSFPRACPWDKYSLCFPGKDRGDLPRGSERGLAPRSFWMEMAVGKTGRDGR